MIKLSQILSEIKIYGKVSPEMIMKEYNKIVSYYQHLGGMEDDDGGVGNDIYNELYFLHGEWYKIYGMAPFKELLKTLNQTSLNNVYQDLLKLENKYNIK